MKSPHITEHMGGESVIFTHSAKRNNMFMGQDKRINRGTVQFLVNFLIYRCFVYGFQSKQNVINCFNNL